jgi:SAM-dependent MidA family methyltransferase
MLWRDAMAAALYGPDGFYTRPGPGPAGHFRTSAHASPLFAEALLRLLETVDQALGRPDPLDLVDIGAGRGELLSAMLAAAPPALAARLRPIPVELAPGWHPSLPASVTGFVVATEWLDNVPVDVAQLDDSGVPRYVLVDPDTGEETLGDPVSGPDREWLATWWPLTVPGTRAEIGRPRDEAWAGSLARLQRGLALVVDYGHVRSTRPPLGTLTGFRDGREVPPVPDGSCDITAHVAMDAVGGILLRQSDALRGLEVSGARPPLRLAQSDPHGYLRRLAAAGAAAELTDPAGLGGHYWLLRWQDGWHGG